MKTKGEWRNVALPNEVSLIVGARKGGRIVARRLRLSKTMADQLRAIALQCLQEVGEKEVREYSYSAQLEDDEVFLLSKVDLPGRPLRRRTVKNQEQFVSTEGLVESLDRRGSETAILPTQEGSSVFEMLTNPQKHKWIDAEECRGQRYLLYAVVFGRGSKTVAFAKRHNLGATLNSGKLLGLFGQTVTHLEKPILIFENDFDLIVEGEDIAVLSPTALDRLFVDLELAAKAVPANITSLTSYGLVFSSHATASILAACGKRKLLAGRLQQLSSSEHVKDLTISQVEDYLKAHQFKVSKFVTKGEIDVAEDDVSVLLDVLDQRHYLGGYDRKLRRSDRNSFLDSKVTGVA